MSAPSPKLHLYRLAVVMGVFFAVALAVRQWATPASWDYQIWYRADAVRDTALQPLAYGGNDSCRSCHRETVQMIRQRKHRGLSCESCHGAFADHVEDAKKVADAKVDGSRWQCANCHAEQINRPRGFPQFSVDGAIGKFVQKHKDLDEVTVCTKCHDPHDPTP